jgi:site-specific DNA recombinase
MIVAKGKSGRYRYYKCRTQVQKGGGCSGRSVQVKQLDSLIRQAIGEKVFIPERVQTMVAELRTRLKVNQGGGSEQLKKLRRELEQNKTGSERLFEAVEKGQLPMDDCFPNGLTRPRRGVKPSC